MFKISQIIQRLQHDDILWQQNGQDFLRVMSITYIFMRHVHF